MALRLGDVVPNFKAQTSQGAVSYTHLKAFLLSVSKFMLNWNGNN